MDQKTDKRIRQAIGGLNLVLESFAEEFPIQSETGSEEPVEIEELVERVVKRAVSSPEQLAVRDYALGVVHSLIGVIAFLGVVNREAFSRGQIGALSYDAYNTILSIIESLRVGSPGFWFAPGNEEGGRRLRELLETIENNRQKGPAEEITRPIRLLSCAVGLARGWCSQLQDIVVLLYRKPSDGVSGARWQLPGGMVSYSDIGSTPDLRERRQILRRPTEQLMQSCLATHLVRKLRLNQQAYQLKYLLSNKPVISKDEFSSMYAVMTHYQYYPFEIQLSSLPIFTGSARHSVGWFTVESILHGTDEEGGIPIAQDIVKRVLDCVEDPQGDRKFGQSKRLLHIPIADVRMVSLQSRSRTHQRTAERQQPLRVNILGRNIHTTIPSDGALLLFEKDSPPKVLGSASLDNDKLAILVRKYDILMYDPTGTVTSRKAATKDLKVGLRGGETDRYLTLQILLLKVGGYVKHDELIRLLNSRWRSQSEEPVRRVDSRAVLKILAALRKTFAGVLGDDALRQFINTRQGYGRVSVGSNLRTGIIIETGRLIELSRLAEAHD